MRVLLLSASSGAGHVSCANALAKAWGTVRSRDEVEHIDILKHAGGLMRRIYTKTYFEFARAAPELLGWAYRRTDRPWKYIRRRTAFDRLNLGRMIGVIRRYAPDLVVSTHFTPGEVVSSLKAKGKLACPQAIVITDFDAHAIWLVPACERYFVGREETLEYMASQGVPRQRIAVTGIPIDPVYAARRNPAAMRRRHGLRAGTPVVLVSAGGFGVGNVEEVVRSLLGMDRPAQVVMVCGRNEALRRKLLPLGRARRESGVRLKVLGFTTKFSELMAAADVLVGKPGGLTSSEALASGLPMAVVNPIPGQEERNADYLLEEGAAIRINNLPAIGWKLARLLGDRARLARMRAAARRLGRPRAAEEVVRKAAGLAG